MTVGELVSQLLASVSSVTALQASAQPPPEELPWCSLNVLDLVTQRKK